MVREWRENKSNRFPLRKKSKVTINLTFFLLGALFLIGLFLVKNLLEKKPNFSHNTPAFPVKKNSRFSQQDTSALDTSNNSKLGLPAITTSDKIVKHFAFTLSYSEEHEQAKWVAYRLKVEETIGQEARSDNFREDPAVISGSATPLDYLRSGFDRGHLVPAADMKWSKKAMSETFLLSNISPQDHGFNSGIWSKLEKKVRDWAANNEDIYIVTGPILKPGLPKIGKINKVSVPEYFYKVIFDAREPELKAIGFIIPNKNIKAPFWNNAVNVDSVEALTGIDFFPLLPDQLENKLESEFSIKDWK